MIIDDDDAAMSSDDHLQYTWTPPWEPTWEPVSRVDPSQVWYGPLESDYMQTESLHPKLVGTIPKGWLPPGRTRLLGEFRVEDIGDLDPGKNTHTILVAFIGLNVAVLIILVLARNAEKDPFFSY